MWKRHVLSTVLLICMVGAGAGSIALSDQSAEVHADEPERPAGEAVSPEEEAARLRQRVELLEQRVGFLEQRLEQMEHLLRSRGVPPGRPVPPLPGPRGIVPDEVPPGWIPFEHDGLRYYIVPLKPDE